MPDPTWLFLSLTVGLVGAALFGYGKKQGRLPQMAAGAALMVYPYFASTTTSLLLIGAAIVAGLWGLLQLGW
ncbi:MAG: hypothetical protein KGN76_09605 [Acidobacteriota bacterium]|nr:hypothetical protein [Acidobacteriota bacterium]